jgi:26S proteasome regulatory subunit N1
MGIAYAGTAREDIQELLVPLIADPSLPMDVAAFAALALGFVFVGAANAEISEALMFSLMERTETDLKSTAFRFAALGLGLLYFGRQGAADVALEALKTIPGLPGRYCALTVETCAYAGTGDVLKVQQLLSICAEHLEEDANTHQAVAALGLALVAMGEDIGAEMSSRIHELMLQ